MVRMAIGVGGNLVSMRFAVSGKNVADFSWTERFEECKQQEAPGPHSSAHWLGGYRYFVRLFASLVIGRGSDGSGANVASGIPAAVLVSPLARLFFSLCGFGQPSSCVLNCWSCDPQLCKLQHRKLGASG
jgi:hypothetical protein